MLASHSDATMVFKNLVYSSITLGGSRLTRYLTAFNHSVLDLIIFSSASCFLLLMTKLIKPMSLLLLSFTAFSDILSTSSVPNCFLNNLSNVFNDICFLVNFMCFLPVSNIALAALVGSAVIPDKTMMWAAADFFMILF